MHARTFLHSHTSTQIICLNVFKWVLVVVPINNRHASAARASYQHSSLTLSKWDESTRGGCGERPRRRRTRYWDPDHLSVALQRLKVRNQKIGGDSGDADSFLRSQGSSASSWSAAAARGRSRGHRRRAVVIITWCPLGSSHHCWLSRRPSSSQDTVAHFLCFTLPRRVCASGQSLHVAFSVQEIRDQQSPLTNPSSVLRCICVLSVSN